MKSIIGIILIVLIFSTAALTEETYSHAGQTFLRKCSACHGTKIIDNKIKTKKEWKKTVKRMKRYGMKITRKEQNEILKYLYKFRTK